MGHYVYKYVLDNKIIYIGKNDTDLYSRLNQHGRAGDNIPQEAWNEINKANIYYCKLANKIMSDVVESEMIRRYKPKYNKSKTSEWTGLPFIEPSWILIQPKEVRKNKKKEELAQKRKLLKIKREIERKKDYIENQICFYNDILQAIQEGKQIIALPEHCCMAVDIPTGYISKAKPKNKNISLLDLTKPNDGNNYYIDKDIILENKIKLDKVFKEKKYEANLLKKKLENLTLTV